MSRWLLIVSLVVAIAGCREGRVRPRTTADGGRAFGDGGVLPQPDPSPEADTGPEPDPEPDPGPDAGPDPDPRLEPDAGPEPDPDPDPGPPPLPLGDLHCRDWPEQHTAADASWGTRLTDIVRHLPRSYGDTYFDADTVTYGHETSHGIHAHIRNYLNDTGTDANGFYVLDGRACLVREPHMRKRDVAAYVPASLRWSRFDLYVVGQTAWDDTPLYVWDEWNAYVNGAEVGVDEVSHGLWRDGWRGTVDGDIELSVYAIAVGMAAEVREPGYFAREPNFRAFLAWNLRRAMRLFRAGRVMTPFEWAEQDAYFERFRTGADAAEMRAWLRRVLGDEVADEVLAPL